MPNRHFIRVDLPAPFSPIKAWTVPGRTVRLTPSSALTPGNSLQMPRISSSAGCSILFLLSLGEASASYAPGTGRVSSGSFTWRAGLPSGSPARFGSFLLGPIQLCHQSLVLGSSVIHGVRHSDLSHISVNGEGIGIGHQFSAVLNVLDQGDDGGGHAHGVLLDGAGHVASLD